MHSLGTSSVRLTCKAKGSGLYWIAVGSSQSYQFLSPSPSLTDSPPIQPSPTRGNCEAAQGTPWNWERPVWKTQSACSFNRLHGIHFYGYSIIDATSCLLLWKAILMMHFIHNHDFFFPGYISETETFRSKICQFWYQNSLGKIKPHKFPYAKPGSAHSPHN